MDSHFNFSGEGVEGGRANDGAGVSFVDCHMWLGTEETSGVDLYRVEDGSFVGAQNLGIPVRHARMVDVEETRG